MAPLSPGEQRALQHIEAGPSVRRALAFLVLFVAGGAASTTLLTTAMATGVSGRLLWLGPTVLVAAASLHGISLFTHEGVHGALARGRGANRFFSMVCAWPVLQNFSAYKVLHLRHHADLGGGLDPDHYANYTPRRWLVVAMNWGRLLLGYPAYITMIPVLAWKQAAADERRWIAFEVVAAAALVASAAALVPNVVLLAGWGLPMVVINTLVNVRGMSQHTLLDEPAHAVRGSRTILSNPVTRFFMCNENYHLEHHLFPRVPWHRLPALHARLRPELLAEGAPFIPSYAHFVRLFIAANLGRAPAARG